MKLLHLKAHNVFSIGTVELDLKDRGLTLVTGWSYDDNNGNMAGKSSVARNAVVWGMYGKTVDGVKADSVINTSIKNAKHCGVTLLFEGVDGETYRIYRARKPNSLVLSQKTYNPQMQVVWRGLSKRLDKDTQELIDGLLGRDHKTFIQADFFGQGRERSFLALPGSEQKAVIEEILPLTSLEEWREKTKDRLKEHNAKVEDAKVQALVSTERVDGIGVKLENMQEQHKSWESQNRSRIVASSAQMGIVLEKLELCRCELHMLKQSIPEGVTSEEFLETNRVGANTLIALNSSASYQIDSLTGEIDKRSARPDECSTCHQKLPFESVAINRRAIVDATEKRNELIKQREENAARRYAAEANVGIAEETIKVQDAIRAHETMITVTQEAEERNERQNPFDATVNAYTEELKKEAEINRVHHKIIDREAKVRDHYHFWNHAFGTDLKTLLFEKICPFLEDRTNQYLRELNNAQIKVSFSTTKTMKSGDTKDDFCVTAKTDTGSDVFELFSGAEKQLTSFAVGMALSDLAAMQVEGASKFMILDEPFLYQSPENCENIVTFLTTHKMGTGSTILLISNEENLANLIQNRVHVVKRNGVSSIE